MTPPVEHLNADEVLNTWRERGAHRMDPVRFRFIEALARRAATHHGEARRILDHKLAGLLATYGEGLVKTPSTDGGASGHAAALPDARLPAGGRNEGGRSPSASAAPQSVSALPVVQQGTTMRRGGSTSRGALAELVDHIARQASPSGPSATAAPGALPNLSSPPELKALAHFRSTWSRLNASQQLKQSMAKVPENAGPLNSHQLVHRSLTLMHELSPEYLHRFMSYVDALSWVNQLNGGTSPAGTSTPALENRKKTARGRSG
jgi:hypothetical protein